MTDTKALRKLLAKATPRPWLQDDPNFQCIVHQPEGEPYHYLVETSELRRFDGKCPCSKTELLDAQLIVSAVNALPDILDTQDALVEALEYAPCTCHRGVEGHVASCYLLWARAALAKVTK